MTDLDDRLASAFAPLTAPDVAEPEPVARLQRRARRHRMRQLLAGATAVAVLVGAITGALVATRHRGTSNGVQLLAPNVLLGDIDAVVLSTKFDENGARLRIPALVRDRLAHVPGIEEASGIVQRFVSVDQGPEMPRPGNPPRTPILFSYHEASELRLVAGALPVTTQQVAINRDMATRYELAVGNDVTLNLDGTRVFDHSRSVITRKVAGIFDVPGIDTTGVPLASVPATQPLEDGTFDRVDLALDPGVDIGGVRDAIARALGGDFVTLTPTQMGLADQRDAEIAIQHAYWALLSPDSDERYAAREPDGTTQQQADDGYARYRATADQAELRVQRVEFVTPQNANVVYRIYYAGSPSPIITGPQNGRAVLFDGRWRMAASTTCQLATYVGQQCAAVKDKPIQPPDGWNAAETGPEIAAPFRVIADPSATVDAREAALFVSPPLTADQQHAIVAAGVAHDRAYLEKVHFFVIGVRNLGDHAQLLYSLTVDGAGELNTPYPVIGNALHVDGRWLAAGTYACGLTGLAMQGCPTAETAGSGTATTGG